MDRTVIRFRSRRRSTKFDSLTGYRLTFRFLRCCSVYLDYRSSNSRIRVRRLLLCLRLRCLRLWRRLRSRLWCRLWSRRRWNIDLRLSNLRLL